MTDRGRNIWYVAHYAGGPGIGRHYRGWHLARHWQALGARATIFAANQHHVLQLPQPSGPRQVEGVSYEFVAAPPHRGNGAGRVVNMAAFCMNFLRRSREYVGRYGRPDMIIASSPSPFTFLVTHPLARRLGARSLLEVRDLWPLSVVEVAGVSTWHPFVMSLDLIERFSYRSADDVVSLLPHSLAYMQSRGVGADHWHYLPNGIDPQHLCPGTPPADVRSRIEAWQAEGQLVVIYAGALGYSNNVRSLLNAMHVVKQKAEKVRAVIVGWGEHEALLRAQASEFGLTQDVLFVGRTSREEALGIMRLADVGYISLLPAPLFRFGISPNKIFDYMMCELPILGALAVGGELIKDAGCGIVIRSTDASAIAEALSTYRAMQPQQRRQLGAKGRAYAMEHHNYAKLAASFLAMLETSTGHVAR
jgi:glycosyltransferase involved in cell wall biosynthesis